MKKKSTYMLLFLVFAIWGFVFYRIFFNVDDIEYKENKSAFVIELDSIDLNKTYSLQLNYRDPFLGNITVQEMDEGGEIVVEATDPFIDWSIFEYRGVIKNLDAKTSITLMRIKGVDIMLKEGVSYDGMMLVKNAGDYVVVLFQGKFHEIYKL